MFDVRFYGGGAVFITLSADASLFLYQTLTLPSYVTLVLTLPDASRGAVVLSSPSDRTGHVTADSTLVSVR